MKKVLVIGSCGAGKSTFAKKLSKNTGLSLIHLDQHYWEPNWERTDRSVFREKVKKLVRKDSWIMDGNYRNTLDIRIPVADTIIFLDFSRWICLHRILKRRVKNSRVDNLNCCKERITYELIKWILWTFPNTNRKEILNKISTVKGDKKVIVLKTNEEIDKFLISV